MANLNDLTAEYVRQILDYNPETGEFRWKARTPEMFTPSARSSEWQCRSWNARYAEIRAGTLDAKGYWRIKIFNFSYAAHRIAWLWMTGSYPKAEIDHIDVDSSNNCWSNLREATHAENSRNKHKRSDNSSGKKGVRWNGLSKKWLADIVVNGKLHHLGYFENIEDAAAVYERAARDLHGEFARTDAA